MKEKIVRLQVFSNNNVQVGFMDIRILGGIIAEPYHTFVYEPYRRLDISKQLIDKLIDLIVVKRLLLKSECSYVTHILSKNKKLNDYDVNNDRSIEVKNSLYELQSNKCRQSTMRFFKTGQGQYSEADVFIGVSVPLIRSVVRSYSVYNEKTILGLIRMPEHECRMAGFIMLTDMMNRTKDILYKYRYMDLYVNNLRFCNNWDLVDISSYKVFANVWFHKENTRDIPNFLYKLSESDNLWIRRISVVGTLGFIKKGYVFIALNVIDKLLLDEEDLINKACGWMLREIYKIDQREFRDYLEKKYKMMSRITLRYAIEKLSNDERKYFLS